MLFSVVYIDPEQRDIAIVEVVVEPHRIVVVV
jgi:hypothetical protein